MTTGRTPPAWFGAFGVGLAACLMVGVLPYPAPAQLAYQVVATAVVVVLLFVIVRMPGGRRGMWWGVWGYCAFALAGDVAYYVEVGSTYSPISNLLYLAGYVSAFVAVAILLKGRASGAPSEALIDTAIITIASASVVYLLVIEPTITASTGDPTATLIVIAYPVIDLVLIAGLIRVLAGTGPTSAALALLLGAFATTFVADLLYAAIGAGALGGSAPSWLDALYLIALVCIAAAAAAPGASAVCVPAQSPTLPEGTSWFTGLAIAALLVPILLVVASVGGDSQSVQVLAPACIAVTALVLWRLASLLTVIDLRSQQLGSLARTDALTGLANRRTLDRELERLDDRAVNRPVTVAMLDLDQFKAFNDDHGHAAGDDALVACSRAWSAAIGRRGTLARYGGEEFALILPDAELAEAEPVLQRLRRSTPPGHSVSVGGAQVLPGESTFAALNRADRALYRAKQEGRNRVVLDARTADSGAKQ